MTGKMHRGDKIEILAAYSADTRDEVAASNECEVSVVAKYQDAQDEWNAQKNQMLRCGIAKVNSRHYTSETFAQGCVSNCLEAVVEGPYTTAIVVRLVGKNGLHSPEGKQFLPGAQRASGGQGEASLPCTAGRTSSDHRPGPARSVAKTSLREIELARVESSGKQHAGGAGESRIAGRPAIGWRIEGAEPRTSGLVSADTPNFRIARSGAGVALAVATPALHASGQTVTV